MNSKEDIFEVLASGAQSFSKGLAGYLVIISLVRKGKLTKEVYRRAFAIASFLGTSNMSQVLLHKLCNNTSKSLQADNSNPNPNLKYQKMKEMEKYKGAIGGGLGAIAAIMIDKSISESWAFILWLTLKAIRRLFEELQIVKSVLSLPYSSTLLSTFFMCLSATQILSTWKRYPEEMEEGYRRFLDRHGGCTKEQYSIIKAPSIISNPRDIIAPNISIITFFLRFYPAGFKRALKLYFPLYFIQLLLSILPLLFRRRSSRHVSNDDKNNNKSGDDNNNNRNNDGGANETKGEMIMRRVKKNVVGLLRSSLFLALYCSLGWIQSLVGYPIGRSPSSPSSPSSPPITKSRSIFNWRSEGWGETRSGLLMTEWIAGLSVLVERRERRAELAVYCLTFALHSVCKRFLLLHRGVPAAFSSSLFSLLFVFASAVLIHYQSLDPQLSPIFKFVLCLYP